MRSNLCLATFVVLVLSLTAAAQTDGRGSSRESLRGIGKVALVIEGVGTYTRPVGSQADTPTEAQVKEGVEEQLRRAGIPLSEPASGKQGGATPALHLHLMASKDEKGFNHYVLRLWLTQEVVLPRATPVKVVATTWDSNSMGHGAGYQFFESSICEQVHNFIEAYKAANSGSAASTDPALLPPARYSGPCPLANRR